MEVVFERASKGYVKDFFSDNYNPNGVYKETKFMYDILLDMVEADPILTTAYDLTKDLITYKGYSFIGEETDIEKARKLFDEELDFDQVIDNITYQLLVYEDAYLELIWNESKTQVMELQPRDTQNMKIQYDKHGEITGYVETVSSKGPNEFIYYATDEIIYFRSKWIGSQVYSRNSLTSIRRPFSSRVYANNYLQSIFLNMPPKLIYLMKTASKTQISDFRENLIRAKTNSNMDLIMQGEGVDSKIMQVNFDNGLMQVLNYVRQEVLMVTRVPPHWVGMIEGANRGIGENVVIPFETKIKKLQQTIASQINKELMPKLNLKCEFLWNAISLMDEKTIIGNMQMMKTIGMDGETVIEYARERGIDLRQGAEIEVQPTGLGQQLQNDTAPSRARMDKKADKMTSNLNQKGVSEAGAVKLESKKVI